MAKTTNHPPYEIDPWKADTTEPPSGLTFNPEIVETAGKPKQAPVPAEPTEGQLKIEESISRVDRFDNEMKALRDQQEKVLKEVNETIEDTDNKIKQLNELEEQIKKQVGEYTDDTDEYLRQSELLRGELQESKAKMEKAVSDASSAISAAEKAQKALEAYKNGEKARLEEAIREAQSGVAKAADVNKQISSLRDSLSGEIDKQIAANKTIKEIQSDNEALGSKMKDALDKSEKGTNDAAKAIAKAQEGMDKAEEVSQQLSGLKDSLGGEIDKQIAVNKAIKEIQSDNEALGSRLDDVLKTSKQGVDDAAKAIELLDSRIDIGGSLLTIIPGTTKPYWTEGLAYVDDGKNPPYWTYVGNSRSINGPLVKVDSRIEYSVSMGLFGYGGDSIITMALKDENDDFIPVEIAEYVEEDGEKKRKVISNRNNYFLHRKTINFGWEDINYTIRFIEDTKFARLATIYFNDVSSETKKQCIRNFRIDPLIPSQEDVDRAQNQAIEANSKAIEANSTALKQQEAVNKLNSDFRESQTKLNKTYDAMWDAQGKRNLLQEGIDSAQTKAAEANSKAIKANSLALEQQESINKTNKEFQSLQKEFNTSQTKLNKTYDAMWDAQGKRNLLQEGIDSAQTKAIKSLSKLDAGTSLIGYYEPTDEEVQKGNARYDLPEWGEYIAEKRYESSDGYPGLPPGEDFAYGVSSDTGTKSRYLSFRPVIPETTYTLSFWAKGSGDLVIYMYGDGQRSYPITSVRQLKINQETLEEERDKNGKRIYDSDKNGNRLSSKGSQWLLGGFVFPEEWTYFSYEVTFLASTRNVRFSTFYWNWRNKSSKGQYFAGMTFTPDIPSQAQIDQSQTEAIKANTLALENQKAINDKQDGIAAAHTKAIDSNRKAIRALAKIDLGGSLLAYMPLTDEEIEKGLTREHIPAWAAGAANVLDGSQNSGSNSAKGYVFLGGSGGSALGKEVYAQVSPGTQYLFEIDLFAPTNTTVFFFLECSNEKVSKPIKKLMWLEKDEYGGYRVVKTQTDRYSVVISSSDTYENGYRYLVEFEEGVEDIYVEKVSWTSSTSITVKNLSFAPYTPSQAAIDARQNKALKGLELAQTLQTQISEKNAEFAKDIYKTSTGIFHLSRDQASGSISHRAGFVMPSYNTTFKIYARTDFSGNFIVLVNYATGIGDGLRSYLVQESQLTLAKYPNDNVSSDIVKRAIFQGQNYYRYYNLEIPSGDVESIIVFIDHVDWKAG